ncbi:MAG: ribosome biogenesis GTPase YlqF [Clostridia bacterium]|nr:ribosome biogenesis GTPase YlqF [Clostridia bacterium]
MHINWYPGHMAAAKRMMEENMKLIDVVIELRDARVPYSSGNPDIERFNKPRLVLLNKADLADPVKTREWLKWFEEKGIPAIQITAKNRQGEVVSAINKICAEKIAYFKEKGIQRNLRALVAGIPNAGKSTLINSLSGSQKAKTGDKPGVTRGKQWVKTGSVDLLDSPGLLWPKLDNQVLAKYLAFTGTINDEILDKEELALELIKTLNEKYPDALSLRYKIEKGEEAIEDYESICKRRGFLLKNREYDYSRCAGVLLDEFRSGALGRITLEVPNDVGN